MDLRHTFIETNGINLHCAIAGDSDAPLMIFLHGFPECWYSWRHQLKEFSADHYVVAPDLRGYNLSDKPSRCSDYALPHLVADIKGLIEKLGRRQCILVGHDWGAMVAWSFATAHPGFLEKLIILNVPHPAKMRKGLLDPRQFFRSWYIFFFQLPVIPEALLRRRQCQLIADMIRGSLVNRNALSREELTVYREAASQPGALTAMVNYYRNLLNAKFLTRHWPLLQTPTLMIWGEQDIALRKELTYGTEAHVSHLTIRYLPDASHWVQQEKPQQVNGLIREFIA